MDALRRGRNGKVEGNSTQQIEDFNSDIRFRISATKSPNHPQIEEWKLFLNGIFNRRLHNNFNFRFFISKKQNNTKSFQDCWTFKITRYFYIWIWNFVDLVFLEFFWMSIWIYIRIFLISRKIEISELM